MPKYIIVIYFGIYSIVRKIDFPWYINKQLEKNHLREQPKLSN